jgi:peptidoglycan/LPS O-acetylase OafA/YrhL
MRSQPLDAIRGLAISLVIACHYFDFDRGTVGVDLFFVLSGYLIGGMLLDNREQPAYFSSFYGRRAFRILPMYWLLLVIAPPAHWGYYLFFAQQIPWMQSGYPVHEPTFVTWSLVIEEQFYLVLPALIYWLPQRWLIRTLWGGVLLAPVWRWLFHDYLPDNSWGWLLPGRLDELFGGVLLASYMRGYCRSATAWGVLACVPPLFDLVLVTTGRNSCMSHIALLCCVIMWSAAKMKRPAMLRPLIWPGRRCYALYLFHNFVGDQIVASGSAYLPLLALPFVALLAVCMLAELSWRFIEAPLINIAKRKFAIARGTHALASPPELTLRPEGTGGAATRSPVPQNA